MACRESIGPAHEENEGLMWIKSPCLGLCERAPAALIQKAGKGRTNETLAPATPQWIRASVDDLKLEVEPRPRVGPPEGRRLLARVGVVDPLSLDDYRAHGGYQALRRAIDIGPALTIREVKDANRIKRIAIHSNHILLVDWCRLANVQELAESTLLDVSAECPISLCTDEAVHGHNF